MQLRNYQKEALLALKKAREDGRHSGLIVMATGLGKTVVSVFDVRQYMLNNKGRMLFLCHSNDILEQNMLMFQYVLDGEFSYGLFNGLSKAPEADFIFASFQTMLDHKEEFAPDTFKYIVVDEAHHAPAKTFKKVISYFKPDFLLGATATPSRTDGLDLEDIFGPTTYNLGLAEAIRRGLLVNIHYNLMLDEMTNLDSIVVDGEKISMGELNRRLFIPKRDEEIARIIKDKIEEFNSSGTLIFCRSIEHAEKMCSLIEGSKVVHSRMPAKENKEILEDFRVGKTLILVSVDQLNEGIDIPHADLIVFLRSTASPLIFYQQLGRGLRLHEGKDFTTVLDFVGNYDRIQIIGNLQKEVYPSNDANDEDERLVINIKSTQFRNIKVDISTILNRLDSITYGWDDSEIIAQVQALAKELGRTPFREEFDKSSGTANSSTAINHFGSWNSFLEAAGLKIYYTRKLTDDELVDQVQRLAKKLGRTPTQREFSNDPQSSDHKTAVKHFGSWNRFLETAGLKINLAHSKTRKKSKDSSPRKCFTKDELIAQVQMLAIELGKSPTITEFDKDPRVACKRTATKHFGSWNKFLRAAGLKESNPFSITDNELIAQVQMLAIELGKSPTITEFDKDPRVACQRTATKHFGSWNKFLEAAGLEITRASKDKGA